MKLRSIASKRRVIGCRKLERANKGLTKNDTIQVEAENTDRK